MKKYTSATKRSFKFLSSFLFIFLVPLAAFSGMANADLVCTSDSGRTEIVASIPGDLDEAFVKLKNIETSQELRFRNDSFYGSETESYQLASIMQSAGFPVVGFLSVHVGNDQQLSLFPIDNGSRSETDGTVSYRFRASVSGTNPRSGGAPMDRVTFSCIYSMPLNP